MKSQTLRGKFSGAALILLIACALAMFSLSVLLPAYDRDPVHKGETSKADSYSTSAIGHAGLYDMLRRTGFAVSRGLDNVTGMVGRHGVLIMAELKPFGIRDHDSAKARTAPKLLLVLPKWHGTPDKKRPAWVSGIVPVDVSAAWASFSLIASQGEIVRKDWPRTWPVNAFGLSPSGTGLVQLVRSAALRPLVGDEDGMLVGEVIADAKSGRGAEQTIWVVADPDVLSNHGLVKGDNAGFMLTLIDRLGGGKRGDYPIVFDETIHGFQSTGETPLTLVFRFPFVVVTALLCATGVMLLLAGLGRFGAPLPQRPVLDFGKTQLIDNSARLLDYAGLHAATLERYIRMVPRSAARALHAPPGLDGAALIRWLDQIGKARGVSASCADILSAASNLNPDGPQYLSRLFSAAGELHRWKGELLHGPARDRSHH